MSVKVFISYAHADQELRKKLEGHLSSLNYSGKITIWQDQEIPAGANWEDEINTHLNEADIILLLVSSDFITSKYCWNKEVQAALERHQAGKVRVIPIILRPALWQDTPLGQLQVLPTGAKPVTQWSDQDAALHNVAIGIRKVLLDKTPAKEPLIQQKTATPAPHTETHVTIPPTPQPPIVLSSKGLYTIDSATHTLTPSPTVATRTPPKARKTPRELSDFRISLFMGGGLLVGFVILALVANIMGLNRPVPPLTLNTDTVSHLKKNWSFPAGGVIKSSPTVVDSVVYVGSGDNNVYAIDAQSGHKKWAFQTGDYVESSPTVANGMVYIGSDDNNVYAIDAQSGHKKWAFQTGMGVFSSPRVVDGIVYVGSDDHNVYAIDAQSGHKKWAFQTGGPVLSLPVVVAGVVYVGSDDHNVYAIDAQSGHKKWAFQTGKRVFSSPTVVDGVLYAGSDDNNIYAIDAQSGLKKWAFQTGKGVFSSPIVVDGVLYAGSDDGNVYAFGLSTTTS
jgi:nitrite reductase/ring-hydroxylating ferredoxin subunit